MVALSARDLAIFGYLANYRYLRSTYLHAFVGGASATRFKERLGDLFHEGFLDRPEQQWRYADARCQPTVHELGEGAKRALADRGGFIADSRTYLGAAAQRQFQHAGLICDVLASIELATLGRLDVRFISCGEILARAPEATRRLPAPFALPSPATGSVLVPDGFFGLEYSSEGRKSYRFFALEIDRATMPVTRSSAFQTTYLGKLDAYRQILAQQTFRSHLGVPNLIILTLTASDTHLQTILAAFPPASDGGAFLFKAMPDGSSVLPRPHLELCKSLGCGGVYRLWPLRRLSVARDGSHRFS